MTGFSPCCEQRKSGLPDLLPAHSRVAAALPLRHRGTWTPTDRPSDVPRLIV